MTDDRSGSPVLLAARSLLWVILLPGIIAGWIPWRYFGVSHVSLDLSSASGVVGFAGIAAGIALLSVCVWEFAQSGRGTLSPADPPRHLVVRGLYRYVRNPMYVAVTLIVLGEATVAHSPDLVAYWAVFFSRPMSSSSATRNRIFAAGLVRHMTSMRRAWGAGSLGFAPNVSALEMPAEGTLSRCRE